jgi:hypothetical protein
MFRACRFWRLDTWILFVLVTSTMWLSCVSLMKNEELWDKSSLKKKKYHKSTLNDSTDLLVAGCLKIGKCNTNTYKCREWCFCFCVFYRTYYKMCICSYIIYYNTFLLWQVLYPIGCSTSYGLTQCIINEWMNIQDRSLVPKRGYVKHVPSLIYQAT